jgi:hypothetical protein
MIKGSLARLDKVLHGGKGKLIGSRGTQVNNARLGERAQMLRTLQFKCK